MRQDQPYLRPGAGDEISDAVLIGVLTLLVLSGGGMWLTGQFAALIFHGAWLRAGFGDSLHAAWNLPGHLGDPRQAWPARLRGELPGAGGFAVAGTVAFCWTCATMTSVLRWVVRHRPHRGFASRAEIIASLSEKAVLARGPAVRPSTRRRSWRAGIRRAPR